MGLHNTVKSWAIILSDRSQTKKKSRVHGYLIPFLESARKHKLIISNGKQISDSLGTKRRGRNISSDTRKFQMLLIIFVLPRDGFGGIYQCQN